MTAAAGSLEDWPMHAVDEAVRLGRMDRDEVGQRIASLPIDRRAAVFSRLTPRLQVDLAEAMTRDDLATLGAAMAPDDLADLAGLLGAEARAIFLADLDPELRACAERLIAHAAGTAGGIMTTDYAALEADATALETLDSLRRKAPEEAAMQRVLVLNEGRLVGAVPLRDVILAPDDARLGELMDAAPIHVGVGEDRETAARLVARYDLPVLPVVEDDGRLVGVITHDDAARALAAETTEDFQKTSTVLPISETIRDAGIGLLYRKRVVWLALLVFGNLFSGAGLAYFEEMILTYVSLVFFLPLLIDSSGNAGAQSATLMVRAMATGEVEISDWTRLLLRELAVAAGLGVTMALVVAPLGLWRGGGEVALVVAATMMVLVLLGSLVGMSLPFLLSRFKLDPATASGPLVTTISDGVGVLVYFTIATLVLG